MNRLFNFCSLLVASCVVVYCSEDLEKKNMVAQSSAKLGASSFGSLALTAFRNIELECKISKWRICQKTGFLLTVKNQLAIPFSIVVQLKKNRG